MLAIDRWRKWRPSDQKFEEAFGCEPPKPPEPAFEGFEGSISGDLQDFSDDRLRDLADWRGDFVRWTDERCTQRKGKDDWGGMGCLLVDFAEWCAVQGAVPCTRVTFEQLLRDSGFRLSDGMVSGLVLRRDLEAVLLSQRAPAVNGTPAKGASGGFRRE
jgi:hypothetical protein